MKDNRLGAVALILGALSGMITMSLHPVAGPHPITPAQFERIVPVNIGVHALAIAGVPLLFLGALALSRRLNAVDRLSIAGLVVYSLGLFTVTIAAAMSGFVQTDVIREMIKQHGTPSGEQWHALMAYTFRLNQAFAAISNNASCAAITIWSIVVVKDRLLGIGLGIYGLVLGPAVILLLSLGGLRLDVHGEGLIVFCQAIWFITAAVFLWRLNDGSVAGPPSAATVDHEQAI